MTEYPPPTTDAQIERLVRWCAQLQLDIAAQKRKHDRLQEQVQRLMISIITPEDGETKNAIVDCVANLDTDNLSGHPAGEPGKT